MERRFLEAARAGLKVQARADGAKVIEGYGAVFYNASDPGTEYRLWDDMVERIMPGAFDRAVREDDVRSLFNHDANIVLGRNKSGTLALAVDSVGLRYTTTPPDTQLVRDQVLAPIGRGDVSGSSFMFVPRKTTWREEVTESKSLFIREIQEVELWEVGPVLFPAYEATTTGTRGENCERHHLEARRELEIWRESRAAEALVAAAVAVRARAVECDQG